MLLGAHVSTAGGVSQAPQNGRALSCTAIQLFTKNQRQWSAPPLADAEIADYFAALSDSGIRCVVAHDTYLINMASPDPAMRMKSTDAFIDEIRRADALKLEAINFHPGSHLGAGETQGIAWLAESLNQAAEETAGSSVRLLIENTSGQGTNLGSTFEQIRDMLASFRDKKRFGVCLDTCHLFSAGYDLTTEKAYADTFKKFDAIIGMAAIGCIHMNDSKQPFGSHKDRHDNIGKGFIGKKCFAMIMRDKRLENVPKILETPGGDEWYAKDLKVLRTLAKAKGGKK
jgi:deoxyribonuclease IV